MLAAPTTPRALHHLVANLVLIRLLTNVQIRPLDAAALEQRERLWANVPVLLMRIPGALPRCRATARGSCFYSSSRDASRGSVGHGGRPRRDASSAEPGQPFSQDAWSCCVSAATSAATRLRECVRGHFPRLIVSVNLATCGGKRVQPGVDACRGAPGPAGVSAVGPWRHRRSRDCWRARRSVTSKKDRRPYSGESGWRNRRLAHVAAGLSWPARSGPSSRGSPGASPRSHVPRACRQGWRSRSCRR